MMGSDSERKTSCHVHVVSGNLTCLALLTKSSQVLHHFIFCLSLLNKKFLILLVFLSCVYIGFDMPFDSLCLDFHPCLYIYIYIYISSIC